MSIKLGDRVKDRISGISGIVTGAAEFLYGCRRIVVTPEEHKDGKPAEGFWIDEPQAEIIQPSVVKGYTPPVAGAVQPAGPRQDARRAPDAVR